MHLRLKYLPAGQHPLHQRSHAQLAGDGQVLVQQSDGLGPVPLSIALSKGIGVVAASSGQFWPVASLAAEGQGLFEVGHCLIQIAKGYG